MFFTEEKETRVDIDKLKKELIRLSEYAILEDESQVGNLRYLLNGAMFGGGTYASIVGMQTSLVVALGIIRELQTRQ